GDARRVGRGCTDADPHRAEERPHQAICQAVRDGKRGPRVPQRRPQGRRPQGPGAQDWRPWPAFDPRRRAARHHVRDSFAEGCQKGGDRRERHGWHFAAADVLRK
ncbi:unnamed protein product, partial [Fusarium equiseti]